MDNKLEPAVTEYLESLNKQLAGLPAQKQQDVRAEVLQHLEALTEAGILLGDTPTEAIIAALRQFGEPTRIGRQIARQWRLQQWRQRGTGLLKMLVAPVSYVGLAALGTTVMALISLLTDSSLLTTSEDYTPWLQRTYWLIEIEAVIKVGQAICAMMGQKSLALEGSNSIPTVQSSPEGRGTRLAVINFLTTLKTLLQPLSYLTIAALSSIFLAVSSLMIQIFVGYQTYYSGWVYWLYVTGWCVGLDIFIKLLREGIGPVVARTQAKWKIFIKLTQPSASIILRSSEVPASPTYSLLAEPITDRRSVPLNTACFLFPPLGLASWLILDGRNPRKARSAGWSAARGTVVALMLFCFFDIWLANHVAILAIGNAHLQPINPNRPFHSLRHH